MKIVERARLSKEALLSLTSLMATSLVCCLAICRRMPGYRPSSDGRAIGDRVPGSSRPRWTVFSWRMRYARVLVDERRSGASFGVERYGKENVEDAGHLVEWIVQQRWSNRKVGALGDSYEGGAAERLAASGHPAVRAIIPRFTSFDGYTEDLFPGGILIEPLLKQWSATNQRLDEGKGVRPVDEDTDGTLLNKAVRDHAANPDPGRAAEGMSYRDDIAPQFGRGADAFSPALLKNEIEASNAAIYGWGGWLDGASAESVLNRFTSLRNPQMAVIGPWNHLASQHASPWAEPAAIVSPTPLQQWSEFLRFFDRSFRDEPQAAQKILLYYTMGEERWKATSTWPPAGSSRQRWFLTSDRHMSNLPAPGAVLPYKTDPKTSTGLQSRWRSQLGGTVQHSDLGAGRLTFVTPPFARDVEVTGRSVATLQMKCSTRDAAVFVYLEDLAQDGTPRYITEGQLRLLHRTRQSFLRRDGASV